MTNQEKRAKDLPIPIKNLKKTLSNNINVENKLLFKINESNDLPMIGGQLLIYDLDETPPDNIRTSYLNNNKKKDTQNLGLLCLIFFYFKNYKIF